MRKNRPWVILATLLAANSLAESDRFFLGDGHSGGLVVQAANTVPNNYAVLTAARAPGDRNLPVSSQAGFSAGDLVMVLQTTGLSPAPDAGTPGPFDISGNAVGTWELARASSVGAGMINLTAALEHSFAAGVTQVIRIPEYTNVTVAAGASLIAKRWDGSSGGVLAFLATGVVVNNGLISANALGFRPGIAINDNRPGQVLGCTAMDEAPVDGGQKGEGIAISRYGPSNDGRGNVANGGGGADCHNSGGGGGANAGVGGKGGRSWVGDLSRDVGGLGGGALVYSMLDHLTLGGGGGAGHENDNSGSGGGRGGGAVFIRAASMPDGGIIAADGEDAPNATANDGAGGGGAGGSIYLRLAGPAACLSLSANGGNGGNVPFDLHGPGGGGGGGRILLQGSAISACNASVSSGLGGTQTDPAAPDGLSYGAEPAANNLPTYVGTIDRLPGAYDGGTGSAADGGLDAVRLAGSCGCHSSGLVPSFALTGLVAAAWLWRRRRPRMAKSAETRA